MPAWTIHIDTLSDWHVGSGFGVAGGIDRLAAVDRDGLPLVPGKTVTGMLRDAAEQLAIGMDEGHADGPWHAWLRWLFGDQPSRGAGGDQKESLMQLGQSPRPARLQVRSAELPATMRDGLRGQDEAARQLRQSLFFVKPGVKIDTASGQAEEKHLRFVQMVRGGLTLQAPLEIDTDLSAEQLAFVEQFLSAAAILVTHIGGKRRRGAGRCRWTLRTSVDDHLVDAVQTVESLRTRANNAAAIPAPPPVDDSDASTSIQITQHRTTEPWVDIPLVIQTTDPICVAEAVIGNVTQTMDMIPGTYLLAHLSRQLGRLGISVPEAIAGDAIRVLPATIELADQRSITVPLAWEMKKEGGGWHDAGTLVNRFVQKPRMVTKQLREGYIACSDHDEGEVADFIQPPVDFFTHNTIDEDAQRPTEGVGGVYSYQALLPNRFRSLLRLRKPLADKLLQKPDWQDKLGGPLRLGRSSKDGYGRARLRVEAPRTPPAASIPFDSDGEGSSATLSVMLLSDTLLEDFRGRFAVTAQSLVEELSTSLGSPLRLDEGDVDTATAAGGKPAAFLRVRRIESWQSRWNLPRPSLVALRAGSCFRLRVDNPPTDLGKHLLRLEQDGIGVRRAEGFGQIAFNHPLLAGPIRSRVPAEAAASSTLRTRLSRDADARLREQAEAIEQTCWRRLIEQSAIDKAPQMVTQLGWQANKPASTQVGSLRSRVSQIRDWQDRDELCRWLDHLADNRLRAKKWPARTFTQLKEALDLGADANESRQARIWTWLESERWPLLTDEDHRQRFTGDGTNWAIAIRAVLDAAVRLQQRRNRGSAAQSSTGNRQPVREAH